MPNDDAAGTGADHRSRPRRRGSALNAAIFQATLAELADVGYAGLTMESVAERARASKASLYRRWPGRGELVMDAVYHVLPDPTDLPDTGSLRGDALAVLRQGAQQLAGPVGEAMRGLLGDVLRDPVRAAEIRERARGNSVKTMTEIVRRAVERGECDAAAVSPRRLEAGWALLRYHFLFSGAPIPESVIVEIVDDVILPLFTAPRETAR
ncbi:AcrR family transcriptional regulator [Spinactinospora alkalitolerans]|uniref:AcrR family transcriptional regulator n=1 Tax=Spinactinospora alkalitolerans TaxID=687207 RepID=A0A852TWS0_9ACTN|nr:TetR/AcrR family transcriptional regulator [Spinactinospora alkalitolerans]NYE48171.1 AcrR family transcriptional regulator [Spinactinospora alkalitolerans]